MKRKLIDIILIIVWMVIIFSFSHQSANISGETSGTIAKSILQVTKIIDTIPEEEQENVITTCDHIIRKIAHYTIYALGGMLTLLFANKFNIGNKKKIGYSFLFGICYAITDEIHQYFIPGRACMWQDVCLDSLGILTGIMIMMLVFEISKKVKCNKEEGK